ncbi:hypothetical protein OIF68_38115 [Actinacidiphila glaucinigra]|nr:hypothetical protein [Actinacidiphila glaucinigra]
MAKPFGLGGVADIGLHHGEGDRSASPRRGVTQAGQVGMLVA